MENYFKGKTSLITGGSSGIGEATAKALANIGSNVIVLDTHENQNLMQYLKRCGINAKYYQCNVSKEKEVQNAFKHIATDFETIHFAFNNAGIEGHSAKIEDSKEEDWDSVLGTNLKGIWLCLKHEITLMKNVIGASIVNCSSVAGLKGFDSSSVYVASKHGVIGLTKTVAIETAKNGIRVNAVCPGVIETPMIDRLMNSDKSIRSNYENMSLLKRLGKPDEIADAVLFLLSNKSSFITGTTLVVDGGLIN
jgi:NAD(P)-dependent dehydrogenase (short-subunit alcohol dehydrogenase family)